MMPFLSIPETIIEPASTPSGLSVLVLIKTAGKCLIQDSSVNVPESLKTIKAFSCNLTYSKKPNGFIGKHMCLLLKRHNYDVFEYDVNNSEEELKEFVSSSDFIVHLAGINRPLTTEEFYNGNTNFTKKLVDLVKLTKKNIPIIMSSSIQAELDNDYGKSKKMGEDYLFSSNLPVYIYRLANVFGKWCKSNYNSACATFCYNIAHDLDVFVRDPNYVVHYNYVEDIVNEFYRVISLDKHEGSKDILYLNPTYDCSLTISST